MMNFWKFYSFYFIFCMLPWPYVESKSPIIHYCYSNSSKWLRSSACSVYRQISDGGFRFGEVFQNTLNTDEPEIIPGNEQVLVLQCRADYPIRWMAQKPLGSIWLVSNVRADKFDPNVNNGRLTEYVQEILIPLGSKDFSRYLRCESFSNAKLFSEIYVNTPSSFFKLIGTRAEKQPKWNFFKMNATGSGEMIVPCLARTIPEFVTFTEPNIWEDAFDYITLYKKYEKQNKTETFQGKTEVYDPRIGFRVKASTTLRVNYSFECTSDQLAQKDLMMPLRSDKQLPAELYYEHDERSDAGMHCSSQSNVSIKFGVCDSILDCDLKWKPLDTHIFQAVRTSGVDFQIVKEGHDEIILPHSNGVKLEHKHGYAHCAGVFPTDGAENHSHEFEFVSESDYLFTGLDEKKYFVSKGYPNNSTINFTEVYDSVDGKEKLRVFECKISTFLLLPRVQFVIEFKYPKATEYINPGHDPLPFGATVVTLRPQKREAIARWQLKIEVTAEMTRISCTAPQIMSTAWVSAPIGELDKSGSFDADRTTISIGISVAAVLFTLLIVSLGIVWAKYKSALNEIRNLTKEEVDEFYLGNCKTGGKEAADSWECVPYAVNKIIKSKDLLTEDTVLGEGQFGIVHKGVFNGQPVAVKSSKLIADVEYFKAFLKEIKLMAFIGEHENIVKFYGAVVDNIKERSCSAVIELSPFGNLHAYLRDHSKEYLDKAFESTDTPSSQLRLDQANLLSFCKQIAAGMNYISQLRVMHGDLAARNVLVFEDNVVKITDFGLSRKLYNCANYTKTNQAPLPWRWMAIESLRFFEFSEKSDVWSFGVTMWEIYSLAQVPFAGINWTTEFADQLESGFRLTKPQHCPSIMFDWMMKCWENKPEKRPTFGECVKFFANPCHIADQTGNVYENMV